MAVIVFLHKTWMGQMIIIAGVQKDILEEDAK